MGYTYGSVSARQLHENPAWIRDREFFVAGEWRTIIHLDVERHPRTPLHIWTTEGMDSDYQVPYASELPTRVEVTIPPEMSPAVEWRH